jgi:hypothetical protein
MVFGWHDKWMHFGLNCVQRQQQLFLSVQFCKFGENKIWAAYDIRLDEKRRHSIQQRALVVVVEIK